MPRNPILTEPRQVAALYTVYENPTDFPGEFVCRVHRLFTGGHMLPDPLPLARAATLDEVRAALPPGLANLGRDPQDDAAIREVWI